MIPDRFRDRSSEVVSTHHEPFVVLPLDGAEAEYAAFRLVAAILTLAASVAIVLLRPDVIGWGCAGAGGFFALMWIGLWARGRHMVASAQQHFLTLSVSGIALDEGRRRSKAAWGDVTSVRVDEERLVLEIVRREGKPLQIHPRYGGLGIYDLEKTVLRAREASPKTAKSPIE